MENIRKQMGNTVDNLDLRQFGRISRGKVRDSVIASDIRLLIATDRLSCFDKVVTTVPFKGEVLTNLALYWFKKTAHLIPNHIISQLHSQVLAVRECSIIPVEIVVRGYLTGSGWRAYQRGESISGVVLPPGLKQYAKLAEPIFTPSTKAEMGQHDEPISEGEIVSRGIVSREILDQIKEKAFSLFKFASDEVAQRELILVDTKFEFGILNGEIVLADEVFTLDSSRFWEASSYGTGSEPVMLDKEPVRQWLLEKGFSGEGDIPHISEEYREQLALHYLNAFKRITGSDLKVEPGDKESEINQAINAYLN